MPDVFNLQEVGFSYNQNQKALTDINLAIHDGEILSIIGANGSGKSTLLHILCGLIHPSQGNLYFKGDILTEKVLKDNHFNRKFRASIGYVFQNSDAQLFCPTVLDELIFGSLQLGYSRNNALSRANEVAAMLNISGLKDRPTYMLSGGEKKRVSIGSILTTNPDIIVFDEPTSGLDPRTGAFIIELIFQLNQVGKTIIIATHHLEIVDHLQSRVVVLSEKHSIEKIGTSEEVLSNNDLLIKANLISEYPHKHDGTVHKHLFSNYLFHQHKH
jgi:cobalt/nickel transport system ATP-binding protein